MVLKIKIKNAIYIGSCVVFIALVAILIEYHPLNSVQPKVCGGTVFTLNHTLTEFCLDVNNQLTADTSERFQRPSKQVALPNKYSFINIENKPIPVFTTAEDVIYAYYGILKDAANMDGYSGGCGTIGYAKSPYPYAYQLLSQQYKNNLSLKSFVNSFKGIGHITFFKIYPAYIPENTPQNIKYYMVEIEVITGKNRKDSNHTEQISYFAYYYGIVSVIDEDKAGWKIQGVYYLPEKFLCAPYHSWFYYSDAFVEIVYRENLKIIEKIDKTEQNGDIVNIYASGKGKQYRFEFVRITNGYDILLNEYIFENGQWKETSLLTDDWSDYKLTIEAFEK